jgi:hypothetical protein
MPSYRQKDVLKKVKNPGNSKRRVPASGFNQGKEQMILIGGNGGPTQSYSGCICMWRSSAASEKGGMLSLRTFIQPKLGTQLG